MILKPTIAIDLGGTKIKMAIVHNGEVLVSSSIDSFNKNGLKERLPVVKVEIEKLLHSQKMNVANTCGIGISVPGIVDSINKKVLSIDKKFDDAPSINFSSWAKECFDCELQMDNDARCAMLGEWKFGNAKGFDDAIIMTLGTGIGSSAVMHGKLLRGKHFMAGILGGHSTINIDGALCNCGNIGCGETEIATWNMEQKIKQHALFENSLLLQENKLDFETVFRLYDEDELAKRICNRAMDVWSVCAINLIHAYDPEVLVLCGGIMQSGEIIIPYMQQKVNQHAWTPWGKVKLVAAENVSTASLLGASCLLNM